MSNNQKKSFWHTLPGILTGIAAIIVAITGLVGGLYTAGFFTPASNPLPAPASNPPPANLSVPRLLSPSNNETYLLIGAEEIIINFTWTPVSNATYYLIEIDFYSDYYNNWYSDRTGTHNPWQIELVYEEKYEWVYYVDRRIRWRVQANSTPLGVESLWSDWNYFGPLYWEKLD